MQLHAHVCLRRVLGLRRPGRVRLRRVSALLLVTLGALRRAPAAPRASTTRTSRRVSVLVVAHNEERVIRERIENLLALDYPTEQARARRRVRFAAAIAPWISSRSTRPRRSARCVYGENRQVRRARRGDPAAHGRDRRAFGRQHDDGTLGALGGSLDGSSDPQVGVVCGKLVLTDPVDRAERRQPVLAVRDVSEALRGQAGRACSAPTAPSTRSGARVSRHQPRHHRR